MNPHAPEEWRNGPPSEKQIRRLRWWGTKMQLQIPAPRTKGEASEIIDQWLNARPDLEDEWREESDRLEQVDWDRREAEEAAEDERRDFEHLCDVVDEWRDIHPCPPVSQEQVRRVLERVGSQPNSEDRGKYMGRFFAELKRQFPSLFTLESEMKYHQEQLENTKANFLEMVRVKAAKRGIEIKDWELVWSVFRQFPHHPNEDSSEMELRFFAAIKHAEDRKSQ